ncbi:hypothetical protein L6452_02401 [Arctium lappa]|uniref:Uncharacterized protein n=1 Tax=Arctium lappa TaxID=4217 RepID=A0ACB9FK89_ARCLA|nr:hypothetical protein L6452_02401 [Arctium lappa]
MAYRRRQGFGKDSSLREEIAIPNPNSNRPNDPSVDSSTSSSIPAAATQSLAAQAIRASSAHRDSSLSSAYGQSAVSPRQPKSNPARSSYSSSAKDDSTRYGYASSKNLDEPKRGFWGALARKARAIIEDDDVAQQYETPERRRQQMSDTEAKGQYSSPYQLPENRQKADNPALQKGIDAIASSLNYIGGTIGNALEEGMTVVENRTADIIQETRKLHIKKKSEKSPASNVGSTRQTSQMHAYNTQPQMQTDTEIQLKASRDVSMAMAAKAKVLLRELKTVKADLAFAKERCAQLEEENRVLRETGRDGDRPEDDDLIRLQLESLLAEKARLAQENSVYARENRFLREIVEYHQLTMQDVVYIDESKEEVSEVYPVKSFATNSNIVTPTNTNPHVIGDISSPPVTPTSPFLDQHKV